LPLDLSNREKWWRRKDMDLLVMAFPTVAGKVAALALTTPPGEKVEKF